MGSWDPRDPRLESVQLIAHALARSSASLDMRQALLCCYIQTQDLRGLGYGSYAAFIRECIDWQPSWQRQLARLLRSELDLVKDYTAAGLIPLSRAVEAPGKVTVEGQGDWIEETLRHMRRPGAPAEDELEALDGERARTVRRARGLARLLLGRAVPNAEADQHILGWHRSGILPEELLDRARQAPPPPDLSPTSWPERPADPATLLVGPWQEPRDLHHALDLIKYLSAARNNRQAVLGRLLDQIKQCWSQLDWGYDRFNTWVEVELGLSVRTAQRLCKAGRTLARHPAMARAVEQGLSLERVQAIGRLVHTAEQAKAWLTMAELVPMTQLKRAPWDGRGPETLRRQVEILLTEAPGLVKQAIENRRARLDQATETGVSLAGWTQDVLPLGPEPAQDDQTMPDPRAIKVALEPVASRTGTTRRTYAPPGLVEAARWLVDEVSPPRQQGCGREKERRDYTCQNPECGHRSLRVHVHHVRPRALGGTDDEDNLRCLCRSCHLRLIHGGFMAIERVGDVDVYLYPGRAVVVR